MAVDRSAARQAQRKVERGQYLRLWQQRGNFIPTGL
jgi:hypothetical protein